MPFSNLVSDENIFFINVLVNSSLQKSVISHKLSCWQMEHGKMELVQKETWKLFSVHMNIRNNNVKS